MDEMNEVAKTHFPKSVFWQRINEQKQFVHCDSESNYFLDFDKFKTFLTNNNTESCFPMTHSDTETIYAYTTDLSAQFPKGIQLLCYEINDNVNTNQVPEGIYKIYFIREKTAISIRKKIKIIKYVKVGDATDFANFQGQYNETKVDEFSVDNLYLLAS